MELTRVTSAAALLERAGPFLLAREAEHNLLLSALGKLDEEDDRADVYLAVVAAAGQVLAAAVMAPPASLMLSVIDDLDIARRIAADLRQTSLPVAGVVAPSDVASAFAETWSQLTGEPVTRYLALRLFRLDEVSPPRAVPGAMRRMAEPDRDLVKRWMVAFIRDAHLRDPVPDAREQDRIVDGRLALPPAEPPGLYVWESGGRVVSMANLVHRTPRAKHVNGVYTPPELRGRGYATALVAAVSQRVLDGGLDFVTLFTDKANPTSNRIYQSLGFRPVCDVDDLRFDGVTGAGPGAVGPG